MAHTTTRHIINPQPGDVVRGRRFGNKTKGNYVISRVYDDQSYAAVGGVAVMAHREYSGSDDTFMIIHVADARIVRSWA